MFKILLNAIIGIYSVVLSAENVHFGMELFFNQPIGTLNQYFTTTMGSGFSFLIDDNYKNGHGIRFSNSVANYFGHSLVGAPGPGDPHVNLSSLNTTLNYIYHFQRKPIGPYLLAGLGGRSFFGSASLPAGSVIPGLGDNPILKDQDYMIHSGFKLAWQVGGGWDFGPRWGATGRCVMNRSQGHTLSTVEAGVTYRF